MNEEDKNQKLLKKQLKNLTDKTEHLQKIMEKGKETVVIRIGVKFIEFGFANSEFPFLLPNNLVMTSKWDSPLKDSTNCGGTWNNFQQEIRLAERELENLANELITGTHNA